MGLESTISHTNLQVFPKLKEKYNMIKEYMNKILLNPRGGKCGECKKVFQRFLRWDREEEGKEELSIADSNIEKDRIVFIMMMSRDC